MPKEGASEGATAIDTAIIRAVKHRLFEQYLQEYHPLVSVSVIKSFRIYGERGGNRTFNLLIKSQLLCQLSYAPGNFHSSTRTPTVSVGLSWALLDRCQQICFERNASVMGDNC